MYEGLEMGIIRHCKKEFETLEMPRVPLLYGSPSDRSLTSPEEWINQLMKADRLNVSNLPKRCILAFRYMEVKDILDRLGCRVEEVDLSFEKAYIFEYRDSPFCLFQLDIGAPMAGAELELLLALGVEYVILIGGVGVLNPEIPRWSIIVPNKAIRDEGTSYHYEKPAPYTFPSSNLSTQIKETLKKRRLHFFEGAVWTTDAIFRETSKKRRIFMKGGAICVDMEAAALFSIAKFRGGELAAVFYAGDYVGEEKWDLRIEENHEEKRRKASQTLLEVSLEALHNVQMER